MGKITGIYTSLLPTQIRLIRLFANIDDAVFGELEVVELANAPPYYALSHAWVESGEGAEAIRDGRHIQLRSNLSACVRRVQRLSVEDRKLHPTVTHIWIDSICINQEDLHERSLQVAMMGDIYSQSIRTIIWLGQENSDSYCCAWELIVDIYAVFRQQHPAATTVSDIPIRPYNEKLHFSLGLPPWQDVQWTSLNRLLGLRWFSRMWVIQEVVLSQQDPIFLQGEYRHDWESLGWAVAWLRRSGYMRLPQIPETLRNIDTISNLRHAHTRWPLDALMSITQVKFHATDQRDKIYGVLGLALECQDSIPDQLKPDYSADVSTIYQRVARFILKKNLSLAVLTRARCLEGTETRKQRSYNLQLPSWCPDWSDFKTYNEGISTSLSWIGYSDVTKPATLGFPEGYLASGSLSAKLHDRESSFNDNSVLQLSLFRVDKVTHAYQFNIDRASAANVPQFDSMMAPIMELALQHMPFRDTFSWIKSFIQSTTARQHRLNGKNIDQGLTDGAAWLHGFLQRHTDIASLFISQSGNANAVLQIEKSMPDGVQEHYIALVCNYCFDRSFITTSGGHIGIGPSNTLQSDTVSVILGGGVPYIMRPLGDCWSFVGEAYIDGLMAGEAIETHKQGLISEEVLSFQ